jgi:putative intracellular protease/amidase
VRIAILIFDKLTALDAVGPYEVLSRLPNAELSFVAKEPGPKRTDTGALSLTADRAISDLPETRLPPLTRAHPRRHRRSSSMPSGGSKNPGTVRRR